MKIFFVLGSLLFAGMPSLWAESAVPIRLLEQRGELWVLTEKAPDWTAADEKTLLEVGNHIRTGPKSYARLQIFGSIISLDEKTELRLKDITVDPADEAIFKTQLDLRSGKVMARVEPLKAGSVFEIDTPSSRASGVDTFFRLWTYKFLDHPFTRLDVYDGKPVYFSSLDRKTFKKVARGEHVTGSDDGITQAEPQKKEEKK